MLKPKKGPIGAEAAQELAVAALSWLAQDEDRLNAFLTATGLSADELRAASGSPQFFSAILDHVTSDDTMVLDVAAEAGVPPEHVAGAAQYFHKDEF